PLLAVLAALPLARVRSVPRPLGAALIAMFLVYPGAPFALSGWGSAPITPGETADLESTALTYRPFDDRWTSLRAYYGEDPESWRWLSQHREGKVATVDHRVFYFGQ